MKFKARFCNSLHEFRKILRKYGESYFNLRNSKLRHQNKINHEWLAIEVSRKLLFSSYFEAYANLEENKPNLPIILNEVKSNYLHEFIISGITYVLYGIYITTYDYYYMIKEKDGEKTELFSCVGSLMDIEERTDKYKEELDKYPKNREFEEYILKGNKISDICLLPFEEQEILYQGWFKEFKEYYKKKYNLNF